MLLSALGRGMRAPTIRRRVLDWRKVSRFIQLTCGRTWPQSPADMLDYIATLVDAGAPKSAMDRALHALRFIEVAGGVLPDAQLSRDPLLDSAVRELQLATSASGTNPTKKAPQVPLSFVIIFEALVIDASKPRFLRMYAWFRLVRIWGALRFDDHRGLVPDRARLVGGPWRATLVRTKTSG